MILSIKHKKNYSVLSCRKLIPDKCLCAMDQKVNLRKTALQGKFKNAHAMLHYHKKDKKTLSFLYGQAVYSEYQEKISRKDHDQTQKLSHAERT